MVCFLLVYCVSYDDVELMVFYIDLVEVEFVLWVVDGWCLVCVLYQGLYFWNFFGFYNVRLLWDLFVGFVMIGGLVFFVMGLQFFW